MKWMVSLKVEKVVQVKFLCMQSNWTSKNILISQCCPTEIRKERSLPNVLYKLLLPPFQNVGRFDKIHIFCYVSRHIIYTGA